MYIGSVRFYKHLILSILMLMIILPTAFSIYLIKENVRLRSDFDEMTQSNNQSEIDLDRAIDIIIGKKPSVSYASNLSDKDTSIQVNKEMSSEIDLYEVLDYKKMYPELYVEYPEMVTASAEKSLFLTFDDGPSDVTLKILEILKEYDVKATFFIVKGTNKKAEVILQKVHEEGHTIGIHSSSHIYKDIYSSVDSFLADFESASKWVEEITGEKPDIYRFPGGSINPHNYQIAGQLISEMQRRGYIYYDWNISSGDASAWVSTNSIVNNIMKDLPNKKVGIILAHDGPNNIHIVKALPEIIEKSIELGYSFLPLVNTVNPIQFKNME